MSSRSEPICVLHVEPDADLRERVRELLDDRGLDARAVTSASDAHDLLDEVDCVVTAYELPDSDGLSFLRAVRRDHPDLPVVLFTDSGSEAIASNAVTAGVTGYVRRQEPNALAALADRIEAAVADYRAQYALERDEQRYRRLIEYSPDPIVVQQDGAIVFVNDATVELTGVADEDGLLGRNLREFFDSRSLKTWWGIGVDRVLDDGGVVERMDGRLTPVDGDPRWVELTATRVPYEGDPAVRVLIRDMTEQKRQERELERTKERFRKIFAASNDAIFIFDLENDEIRECNPTACEMLGYPRDDLLDLPVSAILPDETGSFDAFATRVFDEGSGWTDELTCVTSDGEALPVEVSASVIDLDDHPYLLASVRNVAERRQHEREARRLSRAMEVASDGVAILDENEEFVYVNRAHAEIYGYDDPDALLGETWHDLYGPEERDRLAEQIRSTVPEEGSWRGELLGKRRDGGTVPLDVTVTRLDDGLVWVARDVSERKRRHQQIQVLNRVLRHNLRNSLNVVLGHTTTLTDTHEDPEVVSTAESIEGATRNLLDLSEKARQLQEMVQTEGQRPSGTAPLGEVLDSVERTVPEMAPGVEFAVDRPVPSDRPVPEYIDVALTETCENAIDHGDDDLEITVSAVERDGRLEISVADTGPGIPDYERSVLDAGEETPLEHGSGMGLWLVNWIVTTAGGEVTITDNEPRGSVVTFDLPVADATTDEGMRDGSGGGEGTVAER